MKRECFLKSLWKIRGNALMKCERSLFDRAPQTLYTLQNIDLQLIECVLISSAKGCFPHWSVDEGLKGPWIGRVAELLIC